MDGYYILSECPLENVGPELIEAINLAGMCGQSDWPIAGGLLDQSSWFLDLKRRLDSETNKIEAEDAEKRWRTTSR